MKGKFRVFRAPMGDEKGGNFLGLSGENDPLWVIGGFLWAVFSFIIGTNLLHLPSTFTLPVSIVPLVAILAYIYGLRAGKPADYDKDFYDSLLCLLGVREGGYTPNLNDFPPHPLDKIEREG